MNTRAVPTAKISLVFEIRRATTGPQGLVYARSPDMLHVERCNGEQRLQSAAQRTQLARKQLISKAGQKQNFPLPRPTMPGPDHFTPEPGTLVGRNRRKRARKRPLAETTTGTVPPPESPVAVTPYADGWLSGLTRS